MNIKPEDVSVETFRAKHQSKGSWSYEPWVGVRLIHKPTGLSSECEEYKSSHRNKAVALDSLYDKVNKLYPLSNGVCVDHFPNYSVSRDHFPQRCQPEDYHSWVDNEVKIHTETNPNKLFHHTIEDVSKLKYLNVINEEEQALQEYFSEVHNIDITSLKQNVNNLKLKYFEKRTYPFASEYYFKGECFMQVNYETSGMVILKKWKCK